jgi:hypothetical protein
MKKNIKRIGAVLVVIIFGSLLSVFLTYAGNKSQGPLESLLTSLNLRVAKIEKNLATDKRISRSATLKWFDRYRHHIGLLNYPDTILYGAYDDNTLESFESIVEMEDTLRTKLPIIQIYTAWGSKKNQVFPALRAQAIYDLGSIPLITWEPWLDDFDPEQYPFVDNKQNKNQGGMKAVAEGKFDAYIDKWANDAKKFGTPFFLRLAHEMNDPYRYPWGPQNNKPEDFVAAWQHIFQRFEAVGAHNVIWLWSPHPAYKGFNDFYPGNKFVDWIGVTTLNYGTVASWSQWWTFDEIFGNSYPALAEYEKPIMITELGCLEVGGNRAEWYSSAFSNIRDKYLLVKGIVFYHNASDNTTTYKSLDWSFKDDKEVVEAVKLGMSGSVKE